MFKHAVIPFLVGASLLASAPFAQAATNLVFCSEGSPAGFDPGQYTTGTDFDASAETIYNRLSQFERGGTKVEPGLATSWDISPDNLTYTFHLRDGVKFHTTPYFKPTREFNADDVVFTFTRMLDKDMPFRKAYPTEFPYFTDMGMDKNIAKVEKIDDKTVKFTLNSVDAAFIQNMAMHFASIQSAEYAGQLLEAGKPQQINQKPIGTGPFIFNRFQKDAVVRYKANPDYFAGKPKVDGLIFAITPDANVRLQKLRRNECQIALSPKPLDVEAAAKEATLKVAQTPAFMTAFVAINTQHPPLDKPEVRQAINLAFDKDTYLKAVFENGAQAANGIYPATTWSYAKDLPGYAHDPQKARELLTRAGLKDGFKTTIWTRPTGSVLNPNPSLGAQLLQADLAKGGIQADIRVIEWGELIRRAKAGEHDLLFMGWAGDNGDPDNFLTPQFSCAAVQSGTNFARYCDKTLDSLISEGKHLSDQDKRSALYQKAQAQIQQQALWLPLAHPTAYALTRKDVQGYQVSPFGRQDFSSVSLKP